MKNELNNFNFNFRGVCLNLLCLGLVLLAFETYSFLPLELPDDIYRKILFLFLAVGTGFILRSIRRKLFFGKLISFHDSLSFEVVIQTKHAVNPLLPEKTFEAEFLHRETNLGEDLIGEWIKLRVISSYGVMLTALAWILHLFKLNLVAEIICIFLVAFIFAYVLVHHKKYFSKAVKAIAGGLAIWAVEGTLFTMAFHTCNSFSFAEAWMLYLFFTILFEMTPVPIAIGIAELPVLIFGTSQIFSLVLLFHFFRLMPQLFLGFVYMPRFKFSINDLYNSSLIPVLRLSYSQNDTPKTEKISNIELTIVIPAYNEEKRLPDFLNSVELFLKNSPIPCEVIVVNDGSIDNTAAIVKNFMKNFPQLSLLNAEKNQGKGAAVRLGMQKAQGNYVMFIDADGATPISELDKFTSLMKADCEIMIASRFSSDSSVNVQRKGFRSLLGMFFYKIVNLLAVPGIKDTQCGFKIFRKDIADKILAHAEETGWAFDVEFLYIAQLFGCGIKEVSVNWSEIEGSKVNPLKDSIKMLAAIFRIRSTHGGFLNDT